MSEDEIYAQHGDEAQLGFTNFVDWLTEFIDKDFNIVANDYTQEFPLFHANTTPQEKSVPLEQETPKDLFKDNLENTISQYEQMIEENNFASPVEKQTLETLVG